MKEIRNTFACEILVENPAAIYCNKLYNLVPDL